VDDESHFHCPGGVGIPTPPVIDNQELVLPFVPSRKLGVKETLIQPLSCCL
jgi:hypothetical protein